MAPDGHVPELQSLHNVLDQTLTWMEVESSEIPVQCSTTALLDSSFTRLVALLDDPLQLAVGPRERSWTDSGGDGVDAALWVEIHVADVERPQDLNLGWPGPAARVVGGCGMVGSPRQAMPQAGLGRKQVVTAAPQAHRFFLLEWVCRGWLPLVCLFFQRRVASSDVWVVWVDEFAGW
ncbi:uncharacterized protein B0I36DRAFT_408039 [Microdochium trichocladiopsis]|uniref:Uncharacterized protein n=1 Tax=Microdochium trichocladiopsis TaxID=1682393 RepID=A0A9P8Y920_9PEZI|nr:uncharacterized protein B0I36DRAFT_408039 [Microdochium trichocladiopsis]KAH7033409.1 hypothetical protein B0I36DRAFT_408039 [Microdochium trichocladiopsis]